MSPLVESLVEKLDGLRQRWWLFSLLTTVTLAFVATLGIFFLLMLFDAKWRFSQTGLLLCAAMWVAVTGCAVFQVARRLLHNDRTIDGTARIVESEFPELESRLINVVQLSRRVAVTDVNTGPGGGSETAFEMAAMHRSAEEVDSEVFSAVSGRFGRVSRFRRCMQTPRDWVESLVLLGVVFLFAVFVAQRVPSWGASANRLLRPWSFQPSVGAVGRIHVTPGDADVFVDTDLEVCGEIENTDGREWEGTLYIAEESDPTSRGGSGDAVAGEGNAGDVGRRAIPLVPEAGNMRFRATIPAIARPLRYRIEIGDSQSDEFRVSVSQPVTSGEIRITYRFPAYLGRDDERCAPRRIADLEAPQYSTATLEIDISRPVSECFIESEGSTEAANVLSAKNTADGETVPDSSRGSSSSSMVGNVDRLRAKLNDERTMATVEIPMRADGTFRILFYVDGVQANREPRRNRMTVRIDQPPTAGIVVPATDPMAKPGEAIPVRFQVRDDYAIGEAKLVMAVKRVEPEDSAAVGVDVAVRTDGGNTVDEVFEEAVETWSDFAGSESQRTIETTLKLPSDLVGGDQVIFRVVAVDRRNLTVAELGGGKPLGPQAGSSVRRTVRIVSREERAEQVAEETQNLRAEIWKILEKQLRTRIDAGLAGATPETRTMQVVIQRDTVQLAAAAPDGERGERRSLRRRLGELATSDMQVAVQFCDRLVGGKLQLPPDAQVTAETVPETVLSSAPDAAELLAVQDRIIEELRSLLGVARAVAAKSEESLQKKRMGDDLPDDVKKKYEEARKKLEEFLRVQRKVMEASEELAKKPVEDFTEEDEQKLKNLAATEDDWSKFLNDLKSDFSKLPEQDFANASIAKELTEIQTEIKMAAGALTKKTVDIAVPLEQLGYEMAENMTTNIERWLTDTPDRERWSQEESPSDADREAPMAELPGELEDLVGELMEDEEDLFSEMEDASSSAIDSLDKGAGWDAADGPISNNSARGVTGNRLPNESEIGGRSGEGRQGRSSGEMVGDEAVGKGGRQTPTRLSADAFQKGQIRDYSKDPTGGATGGGKESGQGGTGLEGPMAPQRQRDLERLAGRQAELRNRAEAIQAKFSVRNRPTDDIMAMIEAMATVESELKAGNYQNALRQRKILVDRNAALQKDLSGGFEVAEDASANLPKEIREKIATGVSEPAPAGWEELSRRYFESLGP